MIEIFPNTFYGRLLRKLKWFWVLVCGGASRKELISTYDKFIQPLVLDREKKFSNDDALRFREPWLESKTFLKQPLVAEIPWMTYPAIEFLDLVVTGASKVFEFGVGGSTIFLAKRVGFLASVEHDEGWFSRTAKKMASMKSAPLAVWESFLEPPESRCLETPSVPEDPLAYCSNGKEFKTKCFKRYASAIDKFDDLFFDVIVIDGRARPSCFRHAISKLKVGGYIVLDNAERQRYEWIERTAKALGFEFFDFWGPGPYNSYFWRTLILRRIKTHFSLNHLDEKLEKYLPFTRGVFVEVGANDGIRQSNSYYFEAFREWRGVLIEPHPKAYEDCVRNRPNAKVVWSALGSPAQSNGVAKLRFAGLMSLLSGAMSSPEDENSHIERGKRVQNLVEDGEVEVPVSTISEILRSCNVSHVDLLIIDVEGSEENVLLGLDLARHQPNFILVEARKLSGVKEILGANYLMIEQLSHHDFLFKKIIVTNQDAR